MSLVGYPKVILYTKFEQFWIIRFWVMLQTLVLTITLTLILTSDLWTKNHTTCRISQGHSLNQVWTLWYHSFLSYALDISVIMHLLSLWPWLPDQYHFYGILRSFHVPSHTLGSFVFWVMLRTNKQTINQTRQTDRQTHSIILPTPTNIVDVDDQSIKSINQENIWSVLKAV